MLFCFNDNDDNAAVGGTAAAADDNDNDKIEIVTTTITIITALVDFAVSTDHSVKMKEIRKINEYLDLARDLKKI